MNEQREFLDRRRDIAMEYYDLCEIDDSDEESRVYLREELVSLIKREPHFLDSYSHLYQLLSEEGEIIKARELINGYCPITVV